MEFKEKCKQISKDISEKWNAKVFDEEVWDLHEGDENHWGMLNWDHEKGYIVKQELIDEVASLVGEFDDIDILLNPDYGDFSTRIDFVFSKDGEIGKVVFDGDW